jgi:replicative DNA helicase
MINDTEFGNPNRNGWTEFSPAEYAYDLVAEQALLKIALHGDPMALQLCATLTDAWWSHKHALLAGVLSKMHLDGMRVDLVSVLGQVTARGLVTKLDGNYLHSVYSGPGEHDGVAWYADRLRELLGRRRLKNAAVRMGQRLDSGWERGDDLDVRTAIAEMRAACDEAEVTSAPAGDVGPQSMAEFLDGPDEFDWIVPGLLERCERVFITGGEGMGKTVLTSQLGMCMAGSVHPFSGAVLGGGDRGIRVTVVDCENSAVQSRRRFRRIISQVDRIRTGAGLDRADWKGLVSIDIRPEGINLLKAHHVAWLENVIAATAPDLLALGPLYKIFEADPSDETAAREVTAVLDGLRMRHGFALLTEAHPGKSLNGGGDRKMEPIGSSLWQRWPENGFGIRRAKGARERRAELMDVVSWRGSREERQWPEQLMHGAVLPWVPAPVSHHGNDQALANAESEWR